MCTIYSFLLLNNLEHAFLGQTEASTLKGGSDNRQACRMGKYHVSVPAGNTIICSMFGMELHMHIIAQENSPSSVFCIIFFSTNLLSHHFELQEARYIIKDPRTPRIKTVSVSFHTASSTIPVLSFALFASSLVGCNHWLVSPSNASLLVLFERKATSSLDRYVCVFSWLLINLCYIILICKI